ncbi:DNA-binding protein [Salmonella enterica subsp. enterica serovar Poona]|nr:DNA-binding protein [Salmonella enterica]ECS6408006.1 DNA-binding protein [Salmonella enterica subsp. enterica serovar Poona]
MSDLNQFRSKGPELLVELAQHTSETIREIIDIEPAIADQIGQATANRMMQVWGGQNVYFPMGMVWKVSQRDREIFHEFDGRNHHELARKFGVSLQWVYSVVKRIRKEELDRMQGKLFDGESDDQNESNEKNLAEHRVRGVK